MTLFRGCSPVFTLVYVASLGVVTIHAQQTAEMNTRESAVTFRSGVNLVPVPVVVRDGKGHTVSNLSVDDFQLFDNGKLQMISKFTLEKLAKESPDKASNPMAPAPPQAGNGAALADATTDGIPDRFIAYLFDDVHMGPSDLVYPRDAAKRRIDASNNPLERIAIFTTSGRTMQEFTSDRGKLHAALAGMATGAASAAKATMMSTCPPVSHYVGDLIYNKAQADALNMAADDAMVCAHLGPDQRAQAIQMARNSARQAVLLGDRDTTIALYTMQNVIARMAGMPGQRTIVMISPGFLVLDDYREQETQLIERAIRANVVIGALDARGLYTSTGMPDASEQVVNTGTLIQKAGYNRTESILVSDVMGILAEGTGGTFYHGTNDMDEGISRTAATPDVLYVLGFSPLDLKLDGKYHNLKITLKSGKGLEVEARRGFYAPRYAADPAEKAKQMVEEALFSREEVHDLPAILQTQYFKQENGDATLSAVAKIDVKKLAFKKQDDRNLNDVTVVTGLFDNDGNFVSGIQKVVQMRLLDDTLEKRVGSGIAVKNSFSVHPGRYVVRMVVRDSEGQLMTEQSSLVEIP